MGSQRVRHHLAIEQQQEEERDDLQIFTIGELYRDVGYWVVRGCQKTQPLGQGKLGKW